MIDLQNVIIVILVLLNFIFFMLGYIVGKLSSQAHRESQPKSFFEKNRPENEPGSNKIIIDERKHVVDIKTSDLEKKYETLGETKKTNENIGSSINKLKNLKG